MGSSTQVSRPSPTVGRSALLLAEDVFAGSQLGQPVAQQPLGFGVDDGDGVGRRALGTHRRRRRFALRRVAEHLGAAAPDELGGLGRQPLGDRTQQDGIGVGFRSPRHRSTIVDTTGWMPTATHEFPEPLVCGARRTCRADAEERHDRHRFTRRRSRAPTAAAAPRIRHRRRRKRRQGRHRRPRHRPADRRALQARHPATGHPRRGQQDRRRRRPRVRLDRASSASPIPAW